MLLSSLTSFKGGKSLKSTRESIRFLGSGLKSACLFVCLFVCLSGLQQLCCRFHRRRAATAALPSLTSFQRWEECEKHKGKHKVFRFRFELSLFVCLLDAVGARILGFRKEDRKTIY